MLDDVLLVSSLSMAADPKYTDTVFAKEEPVYFDGLLCVVSQQSCWMTWSADLLLVLPVWLSSFIM